MNIKELCVLNRALDGKDICLLPSFSLLKLSDLLIEPIKDGMIQKGMLKSRDELSEDGAVIVNRLDMYKKAKKHIQINDLTIGILNENSSVLIKHNPYLDDYQVLLSDSTDMLEQLCEVYPFLKTEDSSEKDKKEVLSQNELNEKYPVKAGEHFRIKTETSEERTDEVFFFSLGSCYTYDCRKSLLGQASSQRMLKTLKERVSL